MAQAENGVVGGAGLHDLVDESEQLPAVPCRRALAGDRVPPELTVPRVLP